MLDTGQLKPLKYPSNIQLLYLQQPLVPSDLQQPLRLIIEYKGQNLIMPVTNGTTPIQAQAFN
jgi:hypothetical protein